MKYYVTNISQAQYTGVVVIKAGAELLVDKEVYDYLNKTFGASGKFTFRTVKESPKHKTTKKTTETENTTDLDNTTAKKKSKK